MTELLRMADLHFSYDGERPALTALSVTLYAGERVAVLGNNGAGKSTFFLCCNGVLQPQQGGIFLHGQPLRDGKADRFALRRAVGLVFQDPDSQMIAGTVEAEISFGPMNLRISTQEVRERVDAAIAALRLEELRHRAVHTLSGGEKKQVALADILAMQPELLLLDEPTSSLDPANTRLLEQHLEELHNAGLGLVISTHDVDFAWRWADRLLVFHDGGLCADAPPATVFADRALLQACGLAQPLLYQVGERLGITPPPKTVSDFHKNLR